MSKNSETLLIEDSKNRAIRSAIQGLLIDVSVGVALVLATFFADKNSWGDIQWAILSFSVFKSAIQAVASYVMRRWLDNSRIPTPLPKFSEPEEGL